MSFHQTRTPGELIERIDGDVDTLSDFFSQFVVNLLSNTLIISYSTYLNALEYERCLARLVRLSVAFVTILKSY